MEPSTSAMSPPASKASVPARQPLQSLPAAPLNKRPTPIHISSSPLPMSTPFLSISIDSSEKPVPLSQPTAITPPLTPYVQKRRVSVVSTLESSELGGSETTLSTEGETMEGGTETEFLKATRGWSTTLTKPYPSQYKLLGSASNGYEELGRGVWSAVYRAVEISPTSTSSSDLLTPPTSPSNITAMTAVRGFLAVKAPIRRDAHKVLDHEARILSYLHGKSRAADYLVMFHGYDAAQHSIILDALPLTLATHAKSALVTARTNFSTKTIFDPVVGSAQWNAIAKGLISGLEFLHAQSCVHGDIKPANVLLTSTLQPLYCDFSSSQILSPGTVIDELSANTPDFSSPELLASYYRRSGERAIATLASDIFALGVTLLVAATGESPYAGARMEMQKLSMAKEGRPLDFARTGEQASRIMKGKVVEKCLVGALERDPEKRITADAWKLVSMELLRE